MSRYFDMIRHNRVLERVARRVSDGRVLALLKQFLKSTGDRGLPQGSPLSPLIANVMLNGLDHALDRGAGFLTYARYLDDMVVLVPDSERGRRWADRALERIREEAEAMGVSINAEKTRILRITDAGTSFAFLGFELRWIRSVNTGRWYANASPKPKKVTQILREVRNVLRKHQSLPVKAAVAFVNPVVRGWVNYFGIGNSGRAFSKVKWHVERKVRRFAAKQRKRKGFCRRPSGSEEFWPRRSE